MTRITRQAQHNHVKLELACHVCFVFKWHQAALFSHAMFNLLDRREPLQCGRTNNHEILFTLSISCLCTSHASETKHLFRVQMDQRQLIVCAFLTIVCWFTRGPIPSLDVSVSLLFLYSTNNYLRHPQSHHLLWHLWLIMQTVVWASSSQPPSTMCPRPCHITPSSTLKLIYLSFIFFALLFWIIFTTIYY